MSTRHHNLLLVLLWSQVVALAGLGLLLGVPPAEVWIGSVALLAMAITAMLVRSPIASAIAVSLGLIASSIVLVSFTSGAPVAHFHFPVMLAAVSLYRDWRPLAAATGAAVAYHLDLAWLGIYTWTQMAVVSAFLIALALTVSLAWREPTGERVSDEADLQRLRLSFEQAPVGMAVLKPSGEFIQSNEAMTSMLGLSAQDLVGSSIRGVIHSDDMSEVGTAWEQIGNEPGHRSSQWVRCMTAGGGAIWCRMSLSLIPHEPDRPAMVIMQLEDVSRTHDEQKRLESLVAGKDRFVAMLGDEIKEPLGLVIDLAGRDPSLHDIEVRAREAISMLDDLVTSARSAAGAPKVMALPIDAETLCRDVVGQVPEADGVAIEISATSLCADPGFTRQILYGLVSNAVRFGGPNVVVRTTRSGPDTVIQVVDDGPEVPEAERERIFSSDLRNGRPATRPAAVGLTLTVGRQLARQMDGDIAYRRTADNHNVFELRLPSEELGAVYRRERGALDIPA